MRNDRLIEIARQVVNAAAQQNVTLRVLGGVAVYMTCPSIQTHPKLQRPIKDVDLVAPRRDFDALAAVFARQGATRRGKEAGKWKFDKEGVEIEVSVPDFREDHRIDLAPRLGLASPTVPLADLLLVKLQRANLAEKDIQDSIALLLDHPVGKGEAEGQIDQEYIAKLCARDWGLFTAVYESTVTLEKVLDNYLERGDAQIVWNRIELIQGEMDAQPKSVGWMLRQILKRPTQVPA